MTTSVLIVEDEPSILELISYTCRTSGMEVRKAANVAEAKKSQAGYHPAGLDASGLCRSGMAV